MAVLRRDGRGDRVSGIYAAVPDSRLRDLDRGDCGGSVFWTADNARRWHWPGFGLRLALLCVARDRRTGFSLVPMGHPAARDWFSSDFSGSVERPRASLALGNFPCFNHRAVAGAMVVIPADVPLRCREALEQ